MTDLSSTVQNQFGRQVSDSVRTGIVTAIDSSHSPPLFRLDTGRLMPSVGVAPLVGDSVVWLDLTDPICLGKIVGT